MSEEAKQIISQSLVHQIERLTAERDALRAQLAEAREELERFAEAVDYYASAATDEYPIDRGEFSLGDLRRARAVLEKIKGGGDE